MLGNPPSPARWLPEATRPSTSTSPQWSRWVDAPDTDGPYGPPAEPGRDWVWREDRVRDLLLAHGKGVLLVGSCAENMSAFSPLFDLKILLPAPPATILARLALRQAGTYGARPEERARVARHIQTVEPLLRRSASLEIDTRRPLEEVLAAIMRVVGQASSGKDESPSGSC